ncbi:Penicillin-binding protein 4* [bacterium HR10]|nr:Penicillin-binding protein 4* [bacterium HR10]
MVLARLRECQAPERLRLTYSRRPSLPPRITAREDHRGGKRFRLLVRMEGQPPIELFPESETRFFLRVMDAEITFVKSERGEITHLVLHQGGQDHLARRIR